MENSWDYCTCGHQRSYHRGSACYYLDPDDVGGKHPCNCKGFKLDGNIKQNADYARGVLGMSKSKPARDPSTCPITSPRFYRMIEGERKDGENYAFQLECREKFSRIMRKAAYSEEPLFEGKTTEETPAYSCANCKYFEKRPSTSPTGFWCKKYNFPDKPSGCCKSWEPSPEVFKKLMDKARYALPFGSRSL